MVLPVPKGGNDLHGSKVFHEMCGCKNFRINKMTDKNGHAPPQTKIKGVKILSRDGQEEQKMTMPTWEQGFP